MAVILNKLVRYGSVTFMQCGGLWNGLLSPEDRSSFLVTLFLRDLARPFYRRSQPVPQPTLAEWWWTEPQLS